MGSPKTLELPEHLDISKVSGFHSTLREQISQGDEVCFVASNVERADTAFIQLLAAFSINAPNQNILIKWQEPSEVFKDAVRLLGLTEDLNMT